ncbi:TonB-dependent siderophore receptor [Vibrio sp. 16]|nr:TonB-dependent siderophore receptor [Vibrio sp. 16]
MGRVNLTQLKPTLVYCAIAAAISQPTIAQETSYFDEVLVWGTKVSSNTESIGAQDMSLKQADHMSDLLRDIPGVDVGGTHSVNQRINIRGLDETDLDIRLDGASQHANMFHHIGNLTLNPDILKSADIQVGSNSVTQNGLGGSVYFETKDAKDLLRYDELYGARVYGGYANNASQQGSLTAYALLGERIDVMVYGHYVQRDDFEDGRGVESFGVAGDTYNVLGKVGFEHSEQHRFEFAYDVYRDSGDYSPRPDWSVDAIKSRSNEELIPTNYDRDTLTLSYQLTGDQHRGKASLYSTRTEIKRDESQIKSRWPTDRLSVNTAENRNTGFNAQFQSDYSLAGVSSTLTYGTDYMNKNSKSTYGSQNYADETAISTAVFMENQWFFTDTFYMTAGLRFDDYQREAETGKEDFNGVTWALASEWQVATDWALFASVRSLFKGPELLESFVKYQDVAQLDDDIKAETGLNTQGGVRFNKFIDEHHVAANLTVFKTTIDDYIIAAYDGSTRGYRIFNHGDMEIKGFELSTTYGYENFTSKLSYSRSDNKDKTNGGPILNTLRRSSRSTDVGDSIALTLDYQAESIDTIFGWTSQWVKEEDNVQEGTPVKEGYHVHNVYAQWIPSDIDNLSITFGIDNLFDTEYASHASKTGVVGDITADDYEPGRNVKLSAAYQF